MQTSDGWQISQTGLGNTLHDLEQGIVYTRDTETGEELEETGVDYLRIMHAQLKQLTNLPGMLIKTLEQDQTQQPEVEYNPYATMWDPKDFRGANAGTLGET